MNKFYIDFDKLMPSTTCVPDDIDFLILDYDDFYDADVRGCLDSLCKNMDITQTQIDKFAAMSSQ